MKNKLFSRNYPFVPLRITGFQRCFLSVTCYMQIGLLIVNMLWKQ